MQCRRFSPRFMAICLTISQVLLLAAESDGAERGPRAQPKLLRAPISISWDTTRASGPLALTCLANDGIASGAAQNVAAHGKLTAAQAAQFRAALRRLPPLPDVAVAYDQVERWAFLDTATTLARRSLNPASKATSAALRWGGSGRRCEAALATSRGCD